MSHLEQITIREVAPSDVAIFYAQQLDPDAIRMAAFVNADRTDWVVFAAHWAKILRAPRTTNRTIVAGEKVAGHIACYPQGEHLEVTYWLGREFWGRGIATQALALMLRLVVDRPMMGRAATDNLGSIRVLQKCGFKIVGTDRGFAPARGADTEEYILRLDSVPAKE
jgi:RimJ/RimL family protein N-acetyltransferase